MSFTQAAIYSHVGAGTIWTLTSLAMAATRHAPRALLALQMASALIAVVAGIALWHLLHSGPFGAVEHLLIVGSFCALIALGLQLGVSGPALFGTAPKRLAGGGLILCRVSAGFLLAAAVAMMRSSLG